MGAKTAAKNDGDKKSDAGKEDGGITVILGMDLHCEGCAKKVKRFIKNTDGVADVKADGGSGKLTVVGKVDPVKIRDKIAEKAKKKVDLISPQPLKDSGGDGNKKPDEKKPAPAEEKKPKEPPVSTAVLNMRLHCDGCIHKIKSVIKKFKGVQEVTVELQKDLVTVKGTMDLNDLIPHLTAKLKRPVEAVPAKKEDAGGDKKSNPAGGGEKKDKGGENKDACGGEKKGKEGGEKKDAGGDGKKEAGGKVVEANKMEYAPYPYGYGHVYNPMQYQQGFQYSYPPPPAAQPPVPLPQPPFHHHYQPGYSQPYAPQMFSDENPNACSVM